MGTNLLHRSQENSFYSFNQLMQFRLTEFHLSDISDHVLKLEFAGEHF